MRSPTDREHALRLQSLTTWIAELRASGLSAHEVQQQVSGYIRRREQFFNGSQAIDAARAAKVVEE